jgi:hypothetical protein
VRETFKPTFDNSNGLVQESNWKQKPHIRSRGIDYNHVLSKPIIAFQINDIPLTEFAIEEALLHRSQLLSFWSN